MSSKRRFAVWADPRQELFHGTTKRHADAILREGIDPSLGEPNTDFGKGFYTTTNRAQAEEWAESKASESGDSPIVLRVTIERTALSGLRALVFTRPTNDYWSLVERCRNRNDLPYPTGNAYDVVYGPVAKRWWGQVYETIANFDQISFHGDRAKFLLNDETLCRIEVA